MTDAKSKVMSSPVTKDPIKRLPKEYFVMKSPGKKSEEDLRKQEQIWDKLMQEPDLDLAEIEVDVQDGYVLLTGTVLDENMRGRIEHKALLTEGICEVKNHIHVLKKYKDVVQAQVE